MRLIYVIFLLAAAAAPSPAEQPKGWPGWAEWARAHDKPLVECLVRLNPDLSLLTPNLGDRRTIERPPTELLAQSTWHEATVVEATIGAPAWLPVAATACDADEIQYGDACIPDPGGEGSTPGAMDIMTGGLFE